MSYPMDIIFRFYDAEGRDIDATEAVAGYYYQDFFSSDLTEIRAEAGDADTADAWLRSAYTGPDCDGVSVCWEIHSEAA